MKTLLKLALRNVFRYKRRTIITFSAISLGLGLMAIGMSLYNGIDKQTINNIVDCQTGHIKVLAEGYFAKKEEFPLQYTIQNPENLIAFLSEREDIHGVESRILFMATIISGLDELPCIGVGVEPQLDPLVFNIKDSMTEGSYLEPSDHMVIIGSKLAEDLDLAVGDVVVIRMFSSTEDFVWNALDLEIKGIFESPNPMVNSKNIFIPITLAQESLGLEGKATEIAIRLNNIDEIKSIQTSLQETLPSVGGPYQVFSFDQIESDFAEAMKFKTQTQALIPLIMLLIATLGIVNTMLMAVLERTREIGMLVAMGMKRIEVMLLFIFEGAFIGLFGSFVGCLIGALGGWYFETKGFDMTSFGKEFSDLAASSFPIKDVFYGDLTIGILVFTLIFGTCVAVLASIYPAYKAVKIEPIRALRYV